VEAWHHRDEPMRQGEADGGRKQATWHPDG